MSYSGGDGQTLGIILTPKHITQLFCELLDIQVDDVVLDPCCGTGGFLIAALYNMLKKVDLQTDLDKSQKVALKKNIRQKQLHGIELRPNMFTIATTNMILRGDGKSNLINGDFLSEKAGKLQLKSPTKGMMNPPYSQGSKANPGLYELSFTEHLLDSLVEGAKCAVIIPQSSLTGKTKEEQSLKSNIYKKHTLEGVISLNKDTFYGVGTIPCIAIFTAGEPHPANKVCKFINFENDGYRVAPHVGLIATEAAKDKKQHLLDVWFDRIKADNKFCVYSTVEPEDEWLYGFYYYNDEIPTEVDFEKVIGDYLTFEFSMIMQNREYLFEDERLKHSRCSCKTEVDELASHNWKNFFIDDIFTISPGKRLVAKDMTEGRRPFIGATDSGNGITNFVSDSNESLDSNVLGVNYDGNGMVISFYHPYECIFTDSVKRFHLKHHDDNKYILLFMKIVILQQKAKYNYGYKFNATRMARQIISFPVTDEGKPDYQYMEQYVKSLFAKKLNQYIEFAKKY